MRLGLKGLKPRAKTLGELADSALFYCRDAPLPMTAKARQLLDPQSRDRLDTLASDLAGTAVWTEVQLEQAVRAFADHAGVKLGQVAQPLRAALTGSTASPGIFEVMAALGRDQVIARIAATRAE